MDSDIVGVAMMPTYDKQKLTCSNQQPIQPQPWEVRTPLDSSEVEAQGAAASGM